MIKKVRMKIKYGDFTQKKTKVKILTVQCKFILRQAFLVIPFHQMVESEFGFCRR